MINMLVHELMASSDRAKEVLFVVLYVHPMSEAQAAVHHTTSSGIPFGNFSVKELISN